MKKYLSVFILFALISFSTMAQKKEQTAHIKTSAICEMCKYIIEKDLSYEKGVSFSEVNLEKNEVLVTYNPKKTNLDKIKSAISKIGYQADNLPANPKGIEELPECCRPGYKHE